MFRTRPTRTWLTILGISVGIGAVLFLVSLGYGLQRVILEKIVFNQAMLSLTVMPGNELIPFGEEAVKKISEMPLVQDVAPMANFTGQAALGELNGTMEVRGADAKFFDYAGISTLAGELYKEGDEAPVLVSEAVLKIFGVEDPLEILGKPLDVKIFVATRTPDGQSSVEMVSLPETYKVSGVVKDSQESFIYVPLKELKVSTPVDHYDQTRVKMKNSQDLEAVRDVVLADGYQVVSLSETIDQANKIFGIIQLVLGLFGAVALVVSSIGMFNTMTVTLLERTNEIGIMRALGASKANLRNLFLAESVIIGFLGGVVGVVVGIFGGELSNWGLNILATKFGGAAVRLFVYPRWFLIIIVGISLFIGFLSGVFPARRAAKMDPLDALRYK